MPGLVSYSHVKSHQDDVDDWDDLPLEVQLNCICDILAKQAVRRGMVQSIQALHSLSFEVVGVVLDGIRISSDVKPAIWYHLGQEEAKKYYYNFEIFGVHIFDMIDWEALHWTLDSMPKMI